MKKSDDDNEKIKKKDKPSLKLKSNLNSRPAVFIVTWITIMKLWNALQKHTGAKHQALLFLSPDIAKDPELKKICGIA